jgi:lysophospholipase L1-like esterase
MAEEMADREKRMRRGMADPKIVLGLAIGLIPCLAGCASASIGKPSETITLAPTLSPTATSAPPTSTPTQTLTPAPTRKWPLVMVFYGDSLLKIGEVGREGKSGYSFVDNLRSTLAPTHTLITANYGGRGAKWAYENWEQDVLPYHPDLVTIWWGFNDLQGCGGFFDEQTDALIPANLQGRVDENIRYLRMQIDALLEKKIAVFVMTAAPITGYLPWSHLDPNMNLVWDYSHRCNYNLGLKQLADSQRTLISAYSGQAVFLVDAWQIYMDHQADYDMYVDIMHPGTKGAQLLADGWLAVFRDKYLASV